MFKFKIKSLKKLTKSIYRVFRPVQVPIKSRIEPYIPELIDNITNHNSLMAKLRENLKQEDQK